MGIKGFRGWFESQFPDAIVSIPITQRGQNSGNSNNNNKANGPKISKPEEFDHVLIDMNQLLHQVLRKSRSDGHGLTLLMKELDFVVTQLAIPTQSLVLAMDGPPSAAKLATQRQRRFATVVKAEAKVKQLERLEKSMEDNPKKKTKAKQLARKKRKLAGETRTLCITPGTDFMHLAEQAILYWAWQRLSSHNNILSENNVKIYLSPSIVAGEGEVKLLEWIYNNVPNSSLNHISNSRRRHGESIALLGGDSDLVLEGLVVPVASSHNVFVLLPDGTKQYLAVNLWETTRTLDGLIQQPARQPKKKEGKQSQKPNVTPESSLSISEMIKVRTDLALLLILNGNDYLPKLRGSSGFNKLFHTYLKLQNKWRSEGKGSGAYLVDPDNLEFNLDFCISYFERLKSFAPSNLWSKNNDKTTSTTPLSQLNNMADKGFLPKPVEFTVIQRGEDGTDSVSADNGDENEDETEEDEKDDEDDLDMFDDDDDDDDIDESTESGTIMRITLGEPGTEDFYTNEIRYPSGASKKKIKQKLAEIALKEMVYDEANGDEEDGYLGLTNSGFEWEIRHRIEGKVDTYLYGLLWNLQTYQDGVCADYSYNYGKRMSPLAREIVGFFQDAKRSGRKVGPKELSSGPFSPPVSAGISCLAALPSPVKHLVPEPYRWLSDESVEEIYASCMDPEDNYFDMKKFERTCEEQVESVNLPASSGNKVDSVKHSGRRIFVGNHYWTVMSKVPRPLPNPFDPPEPFSERLSKLRPNNRIKLSRVMASSEPLPRAAWKGGTSESRKRGFVSKESRDFSHSDPGPVLSNIGTVDKVDYKVAYEKKKKERKGLRKAKITMTLDIQSMEPEVPPPKKSRKIDTGSKVGISGNIDIEARMKAFNLKTPKPEPPTMKDGNTPMAVLKQLSDADMIGEVQWEIKKPSQTEFASFDPTGHEHVCLFVSKSDKKGKGILRKDLFYEQDRAVNLLSRRVLQQHLAMLALCDIVGPSARWSEMTFKELKKFLTDTKIEG